MLKDEVLRLLDKGEFVSGQDMCNTLGVSRTAVWKAVAKLKEEGFAIEAVTNRGYRLEKEQDLMNKSILQKELSARGVNIAVHYFKSLDSTNIRAKQEAENEGGAAALFVADEQTAGRGRRGREWKSPPGSGIWMSLLLKPDMPPHIAPMITLIAALSVAEAVREETGLDAGIKWPNDVVCDGRKICGILTEMNADIDGIRYVVCGIGINANTGYFPEDIAATATSIALETGENIKRAALAAAVVKRFMEYFEKFLKERGLEFIKSPYEELLVNKGREVRVLDPDSPYNAAAEGINDRGELIVRLESGEIREVNSGEVSVRGVYGYV